MARGRKPWARVVAAGLLALCCGPIAAIVALSSDFEPSSPFAPPYASFPGASLAASDAVAPTGPRDAAGQGPNDSASVSRGLGGGAPRLNLGSVSVGGRYDSVLGVIGDARYAARLNESWAAGLLGEYGPNQYRLNATLGHQLWDDAQLKFTGEYLSQVLPFSFDSGAVEERVGQSAFGLQVRQTLDHAIFRSLYAGGYWAKAPSKSLASQTMTVNSLSYTNDRRLAGSTSRGFDIGTDLLLTPSTLLKASLLYDAVDFDTLYGGPSRDRSGLGSGLRLEQRLDERTRLALHAEHRAIYDTYGAELQWLPEQAPFGLGVSLLAERVVGHGQAPSSNIFGLNFSFAFGPDTGTRSAYEMIMAATRTSDLLAWVREPAVMMTRVAVESEQRTRLNGPVSGAVTPSSGPTTGGTSVTISGSNFAGGATVTFGGAAATSVTVVNATTITAVTPANAAGTVDVVITTSGGSTTLAAAFTYINATPAVVSVAPSSGPGAGGTSVTLTGTNFAGATAVTFGATAAAGFTVDSDTSITATTPAGTGTVDVSVTTPAGSGTLSSAFTYQVAIIFLTGSPSQGNLGGLSGADARCNIDSAKPSSGFAAGYTYKALLNGNNATTSGVIYYRTNGTTPIATATGGNLVGASSLLNAITTTSTTVWTGASSSCSNWTSASVGISATIGASSSASSTYWNNALASCAGGRRLYCVSQ